MAHPCSVDSVVIPLKDGCNLTIFADSVIDQNTLLNQNSGDALDNGEEPLQLLEGCLYEYALPPDFKLCEESSDIVRSSKTSKDGCRGRLRPNTYVGRLALKILHSSGEPFDETAVEVRSIKAEYRSEYRSMLEDITSHCVELLMMHSSPVTHRFAVDHDTSSRTLYQRLAFVKSIVDSEDFSNAVHRITAMPVTGWHHRTEERDIRRAGRIRPSQLRQIASGSDRIRLPEGHPLRNQSLKSVPARLTSQAKIDTVDIPENRFIKHALQEFKSFCSHICSHLEIKGREDSPLFAGAKVLEEKLGEYLSHSVFRELSRLHTLPLNSPVLQRKEGYREILRVWLMFDLAAKLCWNAFDGEQYHAGKRDAATLYEYWVFFKLLEVVKSVFSIRSKDIEKLIQPTGDGMGLQLRQGRHIALYGDCILNNRRLKVRFSYNRTFSKSDYPGPGSWTQQMRPDYTLSVWPWAFLEDEAEKQELIVHIHFDAKYKVEGLKYLFVEEPIPPEPDNFDELSEEEQNEWLEAVNIEKTEQKEGSYKRVDLLKMHAYKDAIRRTAGAYVLYPGTDPYKRSGFHEIIPGLGAFPLSPSGNGNGTEELRSFIVDVVRNLTNRTSHREELSYYTYDVNRIEPSGETVCEPLPEKFGDTRIEPLRKTTVLVGFYRAEQYAWIKANGLYNIRLDNKGLEKYGPAETGAKYLLLHGKGGLETGDLWEITGQSPEVMTKSELVALGYPDPGREHYLVYTAKPAVRPEFGGCIWDVRKLKDAKGYGYTRPFAVSMPELMKAKQ